MVTGFYALLIVSAIISHLPAMLLQVIKRNSELKMGVKPSHRPTDTWMMVVEHTGFVFNELATLGMA